MKKLLTPFIGIVLCFVSCKTDVKKDENSFESPQTEVIDHHTSQNSLDWAGTYKGTLPCADCPGIKTTIILFESGEFELEEEYLERSFTRQDKGTFEWNDSGNTIILQGENDKTPRAFKVGENQIIHLDSERKEITGNLADAYILKKE